MERYTKEELNNHKTLYYDYVMEKLLEFEKSSATNLILKKMNPIDRLNLSDLEVRDICKYVQFLMITESKRIYFYLEWFRYVR
jgi:hypothetical protein